MPCGGGDFAGRAMFAGTKSSDPLSAPLGPAETSEIKGRFSSNDVASLLAANKVSPGAAGGSSKDAGMRWRAPKPSTQPNAPSPPQLRVGVMVTGRVTLYSWLYTRSRSGRFINCTHVSCDCETELRSSYIFDELTQS